MVFNSVHFIVFFAVVYGLYRALGHRAQNWLLLVGSYYFYAAWDWRFLGLLLASTLVDYACGRYLARQIDTRRRRLALVASLTFNLSMLGVFKYFNFFADNLQVLLSLVGWHPDVFTVRVLLPIGISFYTFITMSYVIDVYRREIEPSRSLVEFAVFVAYFPHLVAGPILRASLLLPQIAHPRSISRDQVRDGLWLILWGLFKKMYVADNLARLAGLAFAASARPSGLEVLLAVYAFAFQIYGDFSGYSDIARGTSKLLGIELNLNFRFPYFVRSPQEFWAHWHISLSAWLRDYLFLPLSFAFSRSLDGVRWLGLRDDFWIYAAATMLTMLLGGLWHGAAWTFVAWGVYQGLLLVVFKLVAVSRRRRNRRHRRPFMPARLAELLGVIGMFHLTCVGWLIFRAESLAQAAALVSALAGHFLPATSVSRSMVVPLVGYTLPLLVVHMVEWMRDDLNVVPGWPLAARYATCIGLGYLVLLFGSFEGAQFIYFQF